jgi:cytochrome c-type biogenesis protein CcmH
VKRAVIGVAAALVVFGLALAVASHSETAGGESVDARTQALAAGLRCPVCQNLSVADSPSQLAGEMRSEIADRLRAGASDDDIRAYFVQRYGEWVLLEPPRRGFDLIPWLVPIVGVLVGIGVWFTLVRRRPRAAIDPDPLASSPPGPA